MLYSRLEKLYGPMLGATGTVLDPYLGLKQDLGCPYILGTTEPVPRGLHEDHLTIERSLWGLNGTTCRTRLRAPRETLRVEEWSSWSTCSSSCGIGHRARNREVPDNSLDNMSYSQLYMDSRAKYSGWT